MSENKIKTLFVGPFAPPFNGDGVKNSFLRDGFEEFGYKDFIWFDTICRRGTIPVLILKLMWKIIIARQVILSLNIKGRFFIIPFFWLFSHIIKKRGVLYVVGGSFDQQLEKLPKLRRYFFLKMLGSLDGIFVESESLKRGIEKFGLKNVLVVYNPRKDSGERWAMNNNIRNKVVFVSRVTETKGVTVLMEAVIGLSAKGLKVSLDIFGPIDDAYKKEFQRIIDSSGGLVQYKGVINPDQVQPMLVNYHFLALPTFHSGEGLPGVLVESGMAGVPIVITRYNALPEYFNHHESAVFVEPRDVDGLMIAIQNLCENEALAKKLSQEIKLITNPFRLEFVIKQSIDLLKSFGWKLS